MNVPTKFESLVREAFDNNSMPITLEVQNGRVVGLIYTHTDSVINEVESIMTHLDPHLFFKEINTNDGIIYQEQSLSNIISSAQSELRKILKEEYLNGGELKKAA